MRLSCSSQRCLVCGDVAHYTEMASTGLCKACAPAAVVIVVRVDPPRPDLKAFDEVPEELDVTTELMVPNEWMSELLEARA